MKKFALGIGCVLAIAVSMLGFSYEKGDVDLKVPKIEDIQKGGYPINDTGETYGGDIKEWENIEPDLILAENAEGVKGYIRASELEQNYIVTPEEAVAYESVGFYVAMYLQDGETKIGEFYVG